jgi:hypothetical protein
LNNITRHQKTQKMKLRTFKPAVFLMAICIAAAPCFAQTTTTASGANIQTPVQPVAPAADVNITVTPTVVTVPEPVAVTVTGYHALKVKLRDFKTQVKTIALQADAQLKINTKTIMIADVKVPVPRIALAYKDGGDAEIESSSSDNNGSDQVSQVKNYSKIYPADGGDVLTIDNRYGDIVVNTWDKNQFKVDVQIKVDASNDADAQKLLDNVNISDAKDGSSVAFRTDIGTGSSSWLSWLTEDHHHKLKILYTVYMPAKNDLVIRNSYGAIQLPDLNGKATIVCAYGSLTAKSLNNESTIRASYSNVDLGTLDATWIDISYGNLNVGTVNRIASNASYTAVKIGKIHESGAFNIRYAGPFSISDIDRKMNDLAINSSYSNVDIGLSGDENVNFAVSLRYGDFGYGNRNITFTDKTPDDGKPHFSKSYKGALGTGNPDKNIRINSSYGNVTFN